MKIQKFFSLYKRKPAIMKVTKKPTRIPIPNLFDYTFGICHKCEKHFNRSRSYLNHMKNCPNRLSPIPEEEDTVVSIKIYSCNGCQHGFRYKRCFDKHVRKCLKDCIIIRTAKSHSQPPQTSSDTDMIDANGSTVYIVSQSMPKT